MAARIQSIERAAAVLQLLARARRQLGVVELAAELELSKTTVFGILRTLLREKLVEQDRESRKYRLGPAVLVMGAAYRERDELLARARRAADGLAAGLEHSVRVGAPYDGRVMVLHHVPGAGEEQHPSDVGLLLPLGSTALGRVLLSERPDLVGDWLGSDLSVTSDREQLFAELDEIVAQGWACLGGDPAPWQDSIAAAIRDRRGDVVAAISISGPSDRLLDLHLGSPRRALVYKLVTTARAMSRELQVRNV